MAGPRLMLLYLMLLGKLAWGVSSVERTRWAVGVGADMRKKAGVEAAAAARMHNSLSA